jgi:signal transduction histidine kinase
MAHEINNPLAGIRTFARLLRRRLDGPRPSGPEEAETAHILETIDAEAGRCGDIVRNLLLFSRASPARFAEHDLSPIVDRCHLLLRHQAEMQGVTLETGTEPGLVAVCDGAQIQQMVLALAMNGLEACPPGGQVTISAAREGPGFVNRRRHPARGPAAHLRALLHHQGNGQGRRAGPGRRVRHRLPAPGTDRRELEARLRQHLQHPPAASRTR